MDEEGGVEGASVDDNVGEVLVLWLFCYCCRYCRHPIEVGFVCRYSDGALGCCRVVCGAVQSVEIGADVGGEFGGADAPVNYLRVRVAKGARVASAGRGVERILRVGVEGGEWRIDVFGGAGLVGEGSSGVNLRSCVGIGVDGLPDCDEAVDVSGY